MVQFIEIGKEYKKFRVIKTLHEDYIPRKEFSNDDEYRHSKYEKKIELLKKEKDKGNHVLIRKLEPNKYCYTYSLVLKNRKDGKYVTVPSRRFHVQRGELREYSFFDWIEVTSLNNYKGKNLKESWGAYIVPKNAKVDEIFYIENLMEDIVAQKFWGDIHCAKDGVAKWDGEDLNLILDVYNKTFIMG